MPVQTKYLATYFEQIKKNKKTTLQKVASEIGVNTSTVSRAMTKCIFKGLLDNDLRLTPYGKGLVDNYNYFHEYITKWLISQGIELKLAKKQSEVVIENCDLKVLEIFVKNSLNEVNS